MKDLLDLPRVWRRSQGFIHAGDHGRDAKTGLGHEIIEQADDVMRFGFESDLFVAFA